MYSLKHLNGEIRKSVVCSLLEKKTLFYTISAVRQACMNCTEVNVCKPSKKYNTHTHINTHSLTRTHARKKERKKKWEEGEAAGNLHRGRERQEEKLFTETKMICKIVYSEFFCMCACIFQGTAVNFGKLWRVPVLT